MRKSCLLRYSLIEQEIPVTHSMASTKIAVGHFEGKKTSFSPQKKICFFIQVWSALVAPWMSSEKFAHITKTCLFKYIENFTSNNWKFWDKNSDIFSSPELCSGWAIVIIFRPSSVRPSIRPSVNIFKRLLLWNRWANFAQISYGASLGWGNEKLLKWSQSVDQDGRHAHIW